MAVSGILMNKLCLPDGSPFLKLQSRNSGYELNEEGVVEHGVDRRNLYEESER